MIDFADQVVIVTGAGRGLGRLYALELARRGAAVIVNDLGTTMGGENQDSQVADRVVAEIRETGGVAVASYNSVANPDTAKAIVTLAVEEFGHLDAVVSNAGIFNSVPFEDITPEGWQRMIDVHLSGSFYLSQPAYSVMKSNGYGRFVFISSSAGMFGLNHEAHYAAAKAGIFGLKNVIAGEGAEHGIFANCVLPTGNSRMVSKTAGETGKGIAGEQAKMESPFIEAIDPNKVVSLVVFLASRACTFNHHNYSACAGRFARVFVGLAEGWLSPDGKVPTAEDIVEQLEKISATEPYSIPSSLIDEVIDICQRCGIS